MNFSSQQSKDLIKSSVPSCDRSVVAFQPAEEQTLKISLQQHRAFTSALDTIFSGQQENRIQNARRVLGDCVNDLPDDALDTYLTEFQHLIDCWLDDYERQIFNGLTLQQLLREG